MRKKSFIFCIVFLFSIAYPLRSQLLPKKEGAFRIAVLGCIKQFEPVPAFSSYLEADPDLCLWIGDNVYADAPYDPGFIQTCYDSLSAKPHFSELKQNYDLMATWDDHDFGLNDAGKEYPFKKESKALFGKFWGLENEIPDDRDGIYFARSFTIEDQTVQIIMLDVRYNRDAPDTDGDVLGEDQWQWFDEQLRIYADLRIIVSGFQILLDAEAGSETWDRFPVAKARLFDTIKQSGADKMVFLTGDQHYGEVCRTRNTLDFDAIELQFAGLNQIEDPEFNTARVSPVIASKHSVAVIDLQMKTTEEDLPHLLFRIADATTGNTELTYRVNLDEITLQVGFTEQDSFAGNHHIQLTNQYPGLELHYTLDGSTPVSTSEMYKAPIPIENTTTVNARLFRKNGKYRSKVFQRTYEKLETTPAITAKSKLKKGLSYSYYEGNYSKLPNFSNIKRKKRGVAQSLDLMEIEHREDQFAVRYEGFIHIPETAVYEFYIASDDGSRLRLSNHWLIDNDGSHSVRKKAGSIALEKGFHPIEIEYFDDTDGQSLALGYVDQFGNLVAVAAGMLFH